MKDEIAKDAKETLGYMASGDYNIVHRQPHRTLEEMMNVILYLEARIKALEEGNK